MDGNRIMDGRPDAALVQKTTQLVAARRADHVLMKDVLRLVGTGGNADARTIQAGRISVGDFDAARVVGVEPSRA